MPQELNQLTDKQKRKLRRHITVNDIAVREELNILDDKIEETSCEMCDKIDSISEQLHEKIEEAIEIATETQKMEGASGYTPIKGVDYNDGKDGDNYVLTEQDKKEIASKITPTVTNKIVERTEIIREQPIVTEITKEIKIENPFILEGQDIVDNLNKLLIDDDQYKIDASHIKNLPTKEIRVETRPIIGGRVGIQVYSNGSKIGTKINEINFGSGITITNINGQITISATASGGIMTVTPSGTVNGTNTSFTLTDYPQYVVIDGLMKPESGQNGVSYWSWSGGVLSINPDNAPVESLFAIY